jgi:hypothetical protein
MKKNTKADLIFLLTFFVISLLLMVNFTIQTVDQHEDDGPIFYANDFVNPQLFAGDYLHGIPVELIEPFRLWTSLQMLIPGLLYKFLNIAPYASTWLLTFLQIFGFGCSIYYFLQAVGLPKKLAWLGVVFAYPAGLWGWSLTYAESDFRSILAPVPAVLCLTPMLFSFALFLKNKTKTGYLLLILAGLIHPPLTLYAIGALTIWRLLETGISNLKEFFPHLILLGLISLIISLPTLLIKILIPFHTLPLEQAISGMKLNVHIWPWGFGLHWPPLQTTLIWIFIAYLGYRTVAKRNTLYTNFWIASLISSVIFGLSHIFGAVIKNTTLMDLVGLRSFTIAVFVSFPLVLTFFNQNYFSQRYLFRFVTLLFFLSSFVTKQYGLSWLLALTLAMLVIPSSPRDRHITPLRKFNPRLLYGIGWVLTGIFVLFFVLGDHIDQIPLPSIVGKVIEFFFGYIYLYSNVFLLGFGIVIIGFIALIDHRMITQIPNKLIQNHFADFVKAGSIALLALSIIPQMVGDRNPEAFARVDVQEWARTNTPVGSVFWAPGFNGWRSYSERRRVDEYTRENYAYVYAIKEAEDYRAKVLEFYGLKKNGQQVSLDSRLNDKEWEIAKNLDENKYHQLNDQFGVTYIVLKRAWFKLPKFRLIYQNSTFDVYEIIP